MPLAAMYGTHDKPEYEDSKGWVCKMPKMWADRSQCIFVSVSWRWLTVPQCVHTLTACGLREIPASSSTEALVSFASQYMGVVSLLSNTPGLFLEQHCDVLYSSMSIIMQLLASNLLNSLSGPILHTYPTQWNKMKLWLLCHISKSFMMIPGPYLATKHLWK